MTPFYTERRMTVQELHEYRTEFMDHLRESSPDTSSALRNLDWVRQITFGAQRWLENIMDLSINNDTIIKYAGIRETMSEIKQRTRAWTQARRNIEASGECTDTLIQDLATRDQETANLISMLANAKQSQCLLFIRERCSCIHTDIEGLLEKIMRDSDPDAIDLLGTLGLRERHYQLRKYTDFVAKGEQRISSSWTHAQKLRYLEAMNAIDDQEFFQHAARRYGAQKMQSENTKAVSENEKLRKNLRMDLQFSYAFARKKRAGVGQALREGLPGIDFRTFMTWSDEELRSLEQRALSQ